MVSSLPIRLLSTTHCRSNHRHKTRLFQLLSVVAGTQSCGRADEVFPHKLFRPWASCRTHRSISLWPQLQQFHGHVRRVFLLWSRLPELVVHRNCCRQILKQALCGWALEFVVKYAGGVENRHWYVVGTLSSSRPTPHRMTN